MRVKHTYYTWLNESRDTPLSRRNSLVSCTICVSPRAILTARLPSDSWKQTQIQCHLWWSSPEPERLFLDPKYSRDLTRGSWLCCISERWHRLLHSCPKTVCSSYENCVRNTTEKGWTIENFLKNVLSSRWFINADLPLAALSLASFCLLYVELPGALGPWSGFSFFSLEAMTCRTRPYRIQTVISKQI